MAALLGIGAILFSSLYFITDIMELFQGGFSTLQLALTTSQKQLFRSSCSGCIPLSDRRSDGSDSRQL